MNVKPLPIPPVFNACFTRRWSSGPNAAYMAHVTDQDAAHSGRMATLALLFWPNASRDLLVQCIVHDLGEYGTGDVSAPGKALMSDEERRVLVQCEHDVRAGFGDVFIGPRLSAEDERRFKFLDRYDAYLMAQINAPQRMEDAGWIKDRERLETLARGAGVDLEFAGH